MSVLKLDVCVSEGQSLKFWELAEDCLEKSESKRITPDRSIFVVVVQVDARDALHHLQGTRLKTSDKCFRQNHTRDFRICDSFHHLIVKCCKHVIRPIDNLYKVRKNWSTK